LDEKEKLEFLRNILNNGINMNFNEELLLKISRKLDKYIVEYLKRNNRIDGKKDDEGELI